LELAKPALADDADAATRNSTRRTLAEVLDATLRLMPPFVPFVTEEIWQRSVKSSDTLMLAPFPEADEAQEDAEAVAAIEWVKAFILGIRRIRGEMDLSPSKPLPVLLQDAGRQDALYAVEFQPWLKFLARIDTLTMLAPADEAPECAVALLGNMKILVPMAGLIDKQAELDRLAKQIEKIGKDLGKSQTKLANDSFVKNAPPEVVEQERGRVSEMEAAISELSRQREKISAL
ncbi:MAG: class I tRNA ligase family protein, partial [Gammaproteobacteria bacterium]